MCLFYLSRTSTIERIPDLLLAFTHWSCEPCWSGWPGRPSESHITRLPQTSRLTWNSRRTWNTLIDKKTTKLCKISFYGNEWSYLNFLLVKFQLSLCLVSLLVVVLFSSPSWKNMLLNLPNVCKVTKKPELLIILQY